MTDVPVSHVLHQTSWGWRCDCGEKFLFLTTATVHVETAGDDT